MSKKPVLTRMKKPVRKKVRCLGPPDFPEHFFMQHYGGPGDRICWRCKRAIENRSNLVYDMKPFKVHLEQ